ncbi:S8 family serine peptidase [Micromonospora sp. DT4]|uniref:S8 family serine peptidase n=1 Tax=Micromonospora sp. DT4 TaxID=3393438 RepID=UPI003CED6094
MRECLPPSATEPARRTVRAVLSGTLAALLRAALVVAPCAPATAAAPVCGPAGEDGRVEMPWALRRIDPASAWPLSRGAGVTVAVIDSGVSAIHPVLKNQVLPGRDFNNLPANRGQCDLAGHGTMVAGIIAGQDGTGALFSGVAPAARILPIRVLPTPRAPTTRRCPGRSPQPSTGRSTTAPT